MCGCCSVSLKITSPSTVKLLLMLVVSRSRELLPPAAPAPMLPPSQLLDTLAPGFAAAVAAAEAQDVFNRSEPARSTKCSLHADTPTFNK
jgi:hypothetical protein